MSAETKQTIKEINETFKKVDQIAESFKKKTDGFDKELSIKIKKAQENAREITTHIEKRIG